MEIPEGAKLTVKEIRQVLKERGYLKAAMYAGEEEEAIADAASEKALMAIRRWLERRLDEKWQTITPPWSVLIYPEDLAQLERGKMPEEEVR